MDKGVREREDEEDQDYVTLCMWAKGLLSVALCTHTR